MGIVALGQAMGGGDAQTVELVNGGVWRENDSDGGYRPGRQLEPRPAEVKAGKEGRR